MALNNSSGQFESLFTVATANVGSTKAETKDFKVDVISLYNEKSSGVPRLEFPSDIAKNPIKANKSLSLYILKDAAYQNLVDAAVDGGKAFLKTTGDGLVDAAGKFMDSLSLDKSTGQAVAGVANATAEAVASPFKGIIDALGKTGQKIANNLQISTGDLKSEDYHCAITLPIPNNLTEDDSHSYEESNGLSESLKDTIPGGLSNTIGKVYNAGDALLQQAAQVSMGANRRRSRQISQLPVLNPYTWKKFKGSTLKVFRFTFFFIPRSKEEAETIMQIVYTLKKYSYGSKSPTQLTQDMSNKIFNERGQKTANVVSDFFISAPPKVLLEFKNPMLQKLLNPGVCVIESIGLTYNEGNTVGMTLDGVPRFIEMNLNLTEHNVRFQEDF